MKKQVIGAIPCFLAALIWGLSFVFQSTGTAKIGTFTFTSVRILIGMFALVPAALISAKLDRKKNPKSEAERRIDRKNLWKASFWCGVCLFCGHNLQQAAFGYTFAGKVGFLTALYMILVPLIWLVFLHRKISKTVWFSVLLACCGIFLISFKPGAFGTFGKGEAFSLCCSVFFALQILVSDAFARHVNCIVMSCLQFIVCGVLSAICMFIFETPHMADILSAKWELLYCGLLSCAGAFTLQLIGQKNTEPVLASMLLCLESVFSVLFGWIILHQALTGREICGCVIMFTAIILTLLPQSIWNTLFHKIKKKG